MFDPTIFYDSYLDDYHKFKAMTLKKILDNMDEYVKVFVGDLNDEGKESYRKTIQADLRQTYFHSIETFFEIFFSLNPHSKHFIGDKNIMIALTQSNWRDSYKKIVDIATDDSALEFLDTEIDAFGERITIGHYLFYFGLAKTQKVLPNFGEELSKSLSAIKEGIRHIAKDFSDREEYNAYKHGLRIIPALKELALVNKDTMEPQQKWNLEDSMSFFLKTKMEDEVKIVTKIFDPNRDFQMACFCSNLISNMVYYRKLAFDKKKDPKLKMALAFFGRDQISEADKINVEIQNLIYTVKKLKVKA